MSTNPLSSFLAVLRPRLAAFGYKRSGSVFTRHGEVFAKVQIQRSQSSSPGDPWFFVNYCLWATAVLEDFEKGDGEFPFTLWHGRLHDEQLRERTFRLKAYESLDAAAGVVMGYLAPIIEKMDRIKTVEALLHDLEARAPDGDAVVQREAQKLRDLLSKAP